MLNFLKYKLMSQLSGRLAAALVQIHALSGWKSHAKLYSLLTTDILNDKGILWLIM